MPHTSSTRPLQPGGASTCCLIFYVRVVPTAVTVSHHVAALRVFVVQYLALAGSCCVHCCVRRCLLCLSYHNQLSVLRVACTTLLCCDTNLNSRSEVRGNRIGSSHWSSSVERVPYRFSITWLTQSLYYFYVPTRASLAGGWTPPATLAQGKEECN